MEKDCYIWGKTLSFLILPCGTVSKPDVNSFLAKVMTDSFTTHFTFSPWNMLTFLCTMLYFFESTTIYHLFPSIVPTGLLVCGKPHSTKLLTCWLLSFGCCFVIVLLHSYIPSYSPDCHIVSIISIEELFPCFIQQPTEKQYLFPVSISGLERNLNVQNSAILPVSWLLSHGVRRTDR